MNRGEDTVRIKLLVMALISTSVFFGFGQITSAVLPAAQYDTSVNIHFIPNDEIINPVDPTNPGGDPVTPEVDPLDPNPVDPGTPGPLSIDYASHINFGEVKKSGNEATYYAKPVTITYTDAEGINQTGKRAPWVQVTDNRGTKTGWTLQVKQATQLTHETTSSQLNGAVIQLGQGIVNSASSTAGVQSYEISFQKFDALYDVMGAPNGSGAGTFVNMFGQLENDVAKDVTLTVPQDSIIEDGKYSTHLTWVLTDAPGL